MTQTQHQAALNTGRRLLFLDCLFCLACLLMSLTSTAGETSSQNYQPIPGQAGKDVVWVPTPDAMVEKMLDMAHVTERDFVIDLGSGDGRNVIAAAKRGARALGVEFNPELVELSRRTAAQAGVGDRATFVQGDMFEADISRATVLMLFLLPQHLARLAPKFMALQPGARIVSNTYDISGWSSDDSETVRGNCTSFCLAVLYIVPARVAGRWNMDGGEISLVQEYQYLAGTYTLDGISVPVEQGRLRGDEIEFTINQVRYSGRVQGDSMSGTAQGRVTHSWSAKRIAE